MTHEAISCVDNNHKLQEIASRIKEKVIANYHELLDLAERGKKIWTIC